MNDSHHSPRSLAGPFWSDVLARLAPRLETAWGELARTSLTCRDLPTRRNDSDGRGPDWEGPLEPFDESLHIEFSSRLCQGMLGRMLGGTEPAENADAGAGYGPGFGRLELQLLERLAASAAAEFCGVLHEVSGLPVTMPCLWLSSIAGAAANTSAADGLPRAGTNAASAWPGRGPELRADTGLAPAGVWRVQVTGTGLAGGLSFGLPEGVLALLEQVGQGRRTAAEATGTVTAEVVLAEVDLPADEVQNLEVGDVIPLGRPPGEEGEPVFLDIPGVGRVPAVVMFRDGVLEVRRLPPGEPPPG